MVLVGSSACKLLQPPVWTPFWFSLCLLHWSVGKCPTCWGWQRPVLQKKKKHNKKIRRNSHKREQPKDDVACLSPCWNMPNGDINHQSYHETNELGHPQKDLRYLKGQNFDSTISNWLVSHCTEEIFHMCPFFAIRVPGWKNWKLQVNFFHILGGPWC